MSEQEIIKDSFTEQSFYIDSNGVEHEIYPMILKHKDRVTRLFMKIDDINLYLNLPTPKVDKKGKIVIDKSTGEPVLDYSSYNAMMELFEIALREPKESIEEWVDLKNGVKILDEFRQVSQLKKKIVDQMMTKLLGTDSTQVL